MRHVFLFGLLPPAVVGLLLRLWNLRDQVLGGDELHTVRFALEHSAWANFTTFRGRDPCLPLTGLYRLLIDAGVELTEMHLRLPMLLCGLALVVAAPRMLVKLRVATGREAIFFSWLLALSPLLVFYSRIVRPYMPVVLLAWAAAWSLYRWLDERSPLFALSYVFSASLAIYFHVLVAPFVLAPLGFAAVEAWRSRRAAPGERRGDAGPDPRSLALVAALTAAMLALLLTPALPSLLAVAGSKVGGGAPGPALFNSTGMLYAGASRAPVALLFWALATGGLAQSLCDSGRRRWALYCLGLASAQVGAILVVRPFGVDLPPVFSRYCLPILPMILLWVAAGLEAASSSLVRSAVVRQLGPPLMLILLVAGGPFTSPELWRTSFAHHKDYVGFYGPPATMPEDRVPSFYRDLRSTVHGEPVIEAPWQPQWVLSRSAYLYQRVHGRRVLTSPPEPWPADPRLRLRNTLSFEPEAMLASSATFLIVHRDWVGEQEPIGGDLRSAGDWAARKRLYRDEYREAASNLATTLRAQWGPPTRADSKILVWDLRAVREKP